MRLFISVALPEEIKSRIGKTVARLQKLAGKIKWVKAENLHLTLKFLGEVKEEQVKERVIQNLSGIAKAFAPFEASLKGMGNFNLRVFWIGGDKGGENLAQLAGAIEEKLATLGFEKEERAFTAHLTIGRNQQWHKKELEPLLAAMEEKKETDFGAWEVDHFELVQSTLTPKGPIYETVEKFPLRRG